MEPAPNSFVFVSCILCNTHSPPQLEYNGSSGPQAPNLFKATHVCKDHIIDHVVTMFSTFHSFF